MAPVTFGSLVRGPAMSSLPRPLSPSAPLILRKNGVNMRRIAQIIVAKLARAAEEWNFTPVLVRVVIVLILIRIGVLIAVIG